MEQANLLGPKTYPAIINNFTLTGDVNIQRSMKDLSIMPCSLEPGQSQLSSTCQNDEKNGETYAVRSVCQARCGVPVTARFMSGEVCHNQTL